MSQDNDPSKLKLAAQQKVMDLLARRDHSEKELRQKLRERFRHEDDAADLIEGTLDFAKDNNWMAEPAVMAERMAEALHRRNKGIAYINNYLREKGLPPVMADRDRELEKALAVVKNKYSQDLNFSREEKARVARFLASRGFDSETVRKVLYEKL